MCYNFLFFVNMITFCLSCTRVGAYSARLKSRDLQLEDNRCLICSVMCDEVEADSGTVMNLYKNVLSSISTEPGGVPPCYDLYPFFTSSLS